LIILEPPYYDDDYLLFDESDDEEARNTARMLRTETEYDDNDSYIIRDSSGVQLGWSDWNENEPSYFDEAYATDSTTFGEQLLNMSSLTGKATAEVLLVDISSPQLKMKTLKDVIPGYEGLNQGGIFLHRPTFNTCTLKCLQLYSLLSEWEDWDNTEAFLGLDSDFGDDESVI